jgi:hypothetical protein
VLVGLEAQRRKLLYDVVAGGTGSGAADGVVATELAMIEVRGHVIG